MLKRLAALMLCVVGAAHADLVKFHNGQEQRLPHIRYENEALVGPKGKRVPRDQIKEIAFDVRVSQEAKPQAAQVPKGVQRLLEFARQQQAKYPDAAGILLEDDGTYVLRKDGSNSYRYHFQGLVLKEDKKQAWSQRALYLDERRERVQLLWARTVQPDGSVVELDPAQAKIVDPAGRTGHFGRGKRFSFSLPQVKVGSIVEYCFEMVEFDPFDPKMFFPGFYFQGEEPVAHSKMTVVVPRGQELHYQTKHMPPGKDEPVISRAADTVSYVWEVSDMAPVIPELRMPPLGSVTAQVHCSPFKTWDYLFDWMERFQKRRMELTPEIKQTVAEVTKGAKDQEEKVARLYHFVQQHIRYVSIKGSIGSGWSGHPAGSTLKNRYGDCVDKAILFGTMLKAVGVESEPVIVLTNDSGKDDRKLPTMRGNHAISHVVLNGRSFYLDTTSTVHRYPAFRADDHGIKAINALRREIGDIAVPPPGMNARHYTVTMTVSPAGEVETAYCSRYVGDYESRVRAYYMYTPERNHHRALSNMVSGISPKARLRRYKLDNVHDIAKPFGIRLWYSLGNYVVEAGDLRIMAVPGIETQFSEAAQPQRRYPIEYSTSLETERRVLLRVPRTYRVRHLPPAIDLETPYAGYHAKYEREGPTEIVFTSTFRRYKRVVPVEDYARYRAFLQEMSRYTKSQMFFQVADK